jgi:predicted unusual protein kinase regulating ubiquinone biosynthesis (AarF/ABC1/UbiB family)
VKRSHRRWLALGKARLSHAFTSLKRAILTDEDVTVKRGPAELAEAEVLTREAAEMRGGMAKLGQLRAYLDGSAPDARARLATLWDRIPADPPARIRQVIREQLGQEAEALFPGWQDRPLAAASLGQVHAAGELAVKVQYPEVAVALEDDLSSTLLLKRMVGADLGESVDAEALARLREGLLSELDYQKEAQALERFRKLWRGDPEVVIPRAYPEKTTRAVLVMQRLEGVPLAEYTGDRAQVAETIFRFAVGSPLWFGVFNADPHPGNYLVLDGGRVGFVDFGCVAELSEEVRAADLKLWKALVHREGEELRHAAHLMGLVARAEVFEGETWREWEKLLGAPFLARGPFALQPDQVRRFVAVTAELGRARRVALPAPVLLLWRQRLGALAVIASLSPKLDFRRVLCDLLDDERNPIPLYERYR